MQTLQTRRKPTRRRRLPLRYRKIPPSNRRIQLEEEDCAKTLMKKKVVTKRRTITIVMESSDALVEIMWIEA
jgi:hypothetical protein